MIAKCHTSPCHFARHKLPKDLRKSMRCLSEAELAPTPQRSRKPDKRQRTRKPAFAGSCALVVTSAKPGFLALPPCSRSHTKQKRWPQNPHLPPPLAFSPVRAEPSSLSNIPGTFASIGKRCCSESMSPQVAPPSRPVLLSLRRRKPSICVHHE